MNGNFFHHATIQPQQGTWFVAAPLQPTRQPFIQPQVQSPWPMAGAQQSPQPLSEEAIDHEPILAERFKTKMCRNFELTGVCPYDNRCMFAHGAHELRSVEKNLTDGLVTEDAIRDFRRANVQLPAIPAPRSRRLQSGVSLPSPAVPPKVPHSNESDLSASFSLKESSRTPASEAGSHEAEAPISSQSESHHSVAGASVSDAYATSPTPTDNLRARTAMLPAHTAQWVIALHTPSSPANMA